MSGKTIDADKLLKWLEDEINANIKMSQKERVKALQTVEFYVKEGQCDVDPIPLPTIKRYRCGECKRSETAYEWNRETELYFHRTMPQIDENGDYSDTFVCPACGEGQPRHTIGEVNP